MLTREQVYKIIDTERDYQKKWDTAESKGEHTVAEFTLYMESYLTEAREQLSRGADPEASNKALHTLRKVAALAVACMEQNGGFPR